MHVQIVQSIPGKPFKASSTSFSVSKLAPISQALLDLLPSHVPFRNRYSNEFSCSLFDSLHNPHHGISMFSSYFSIFPFQFASFKSFPTFFSLLSFSNPQFYFIALQSKVLSIHRQTIKVQKLFFVAISFCWKIPGIFFSLRRWKFAIIFFAERKTCFCEGAFLLWHIDGVKVMKKFSCKILWCLALNSWKVLSLLLPYLNMCSLQMWQPQRSKIELWVPFRRWWKGAVRTKGNFLCMLSTFPSAWLRNWRFCQYVGILLTDSLA